MVDLGQKGRKEIFAFFIFPKNPPKKQISLSFAYHSNIISLKKRNIRFDVIRFALP